MRSYVAVLAVFYLSVASSGAEQVSLSDVAEHAVMQSKLSAPGSRPFHLKATIVETTNPASDYKAEVEEYWVSPEKWRRTIKSPHFTQTFVTNGSKVVEQDTGDYYPWWLRDLVTALSDPLPMLGQLKKLDKQMARPAGGENASSCADLESKVGTPPTQISEFSSFCFEGGHGLLHYIVSPGYHAMFKDYKKFKDKWVARRIVINPKPGMKIEASVTQLAELKTPDETMFSIQEPTPDAERLRSVQVSDSTVRGMSLNTPDIIWPTVRAGKTSGVLSLYVSLDRAGHVREAWPLNSDAGLGRESNVLDDAAREQVQKWQFKPASVDGKAVQLESVMTFAFSTKIADAYAVLSDEEARKLAKNVVEPVFSAGAVPRGTAVTVRIFVEEDGTVRSMKYPQKLAIQLNEPVWQAIRNWKFRPYLRKGRADAFMADITFHVR